MILRIFAMLLVVFALSSTTVYAKTPAEECTDATAALGQDISCKECGDCAVVTLRTGEKICKKCNEYQCDKVECNECSDSECATK